jgi:hypothetical protein
VEKLEEEGKTGGDLPCFNTSHNICNAKYRVSEINTLNIGFKRHTPQKAHG